MQVGTTRHLARKRQSLPKTVVIHELQPYRHQVLFTENREDFASVGVCLSGERLDSSLCSGRTAKVDDEDGSRIYVIGVFKPSIALLAHECSHVIFDLFGRIGIDARDSEGEVFCYLLQGMIEKFSPYLKGD